MCFAPQRRALFGHLNFQKCSENGVFVQLRATTACTFSTSQLPKVVRHWCVLCVLTSKCASRHNSVHFSHISTFKSGPTLVCFVHFDFQMCFAPRRSATLHLSSGQMAPQPLLLRAYLSGLRSHKSLEKHSNLRLSYLFAHLDLLSSATFSFLVFFLLFSSLLVSSLLFSALLFSSLLCSALLFSSLTLPISAFHLSILSEV